MSASLNRWQNSIRTKKEALQALKGLVGSFGTAGIPSLWRVVVILAACLFAISLAAPLCAQEHRSKVPIVSKLTPGNREQAFSGQVQSLDMKQKILNVNSRHGRDSEIFPVKKNVRVESIDGQKMKLTELVPGMTVLIYFDQKSGERTVKNIIVLSTGKNQGKGKPAPSS